MNNIEILAPCGSFESVYPAVRLGANAIYFGSERFSARGKAKNFDDLEMKNMIDYCHVRGVKAYLALNTLIKDKEIKDALSLLEYVCSIPVDAIIVQDIGFANLVKKIAPQMRLHASTQMSVHTPSGAKYLYEKGFSRVVLSRELSKKEIKEISLVSPIELEVFVHGSLCMSVSGQCYFSAMMGGRSANRGLCAQPCRLPFMVSGGTGHDLSLKDLSIIKYIQELSDIGVVSAKIEGRMKRPEYVAAAVKACSEAKKGLNPNIKQLESIFSRSGFTDGYYKGNIGKDMFGIRQKENVISATNKVFSEMHKLYNNEKPLIKIKIELIIKQNEKIKLKIVDQDNNQVITEGKIPEKAIKKEITKEKCVFQLIKTGGTPFYCKKSDVLISLDENLSISFSELNNLRREAIKKLEDLRKAREKPCFYHNKLEIKEMYVPRETCKLRADFPDTNIPQIYQKYELVYIPLNSKEEDVYNLLDNNLKLAVKIPRGMFGQEEKIVKKLKSIKSLGINDVYLNNLGAIKIAKELKMNMHGGFGLNLMNSFSLNWAEKEGFDDVELSIELGIKEINQLKCKIKRGIIVYGRLPLMLTRSCPVKNKKNTCINCKHINYIKDRKNIEFPILCDTVCSEVLNSAPIFLKDNKNFLSNLDFKVSKLNVENYVEREENFKVLNNKKIISSSFTYGLYYKTVD